MNPFNPGRGDTRPGFQNSKHCTHEEEVPSFDGCLLDRTDRNRPGQEFPHFPLLRAVQYGRQRPDRAAGFRRGVRQLPEPVGREFLRQVPQDGEVVQGPAAAVPREYRIDAGRLFRPHPAGEPPGRPQGGHRARRYRRHQHRRFPAGPHRRVREDGAGVDEAHAGGLRRPSVRPARGDGQDCEEERRDFRHPDASGRDEHRRPEVAGRCEDRL